jgi:hypothetical protein
VAQIFVHGGGSGGGAWQSEYYLFLFSRFVTFIGRAVWRKVKKIRCA